MYQSIYLMVPIQEKEEIREKYTVKAITNDIQGKTEDKKEKMGQKQRGKDSDTVGRDHVYFFKVPVSHPSKKSHLHSFFFLCRQAMLDMEVNSDVALNQLSKSQNSLGWKVP